MPHGRMYASLVNMCCRNRKYERAQELLDEMEKDGHTVSNALRAKAQGPKIDS